METIATLLVLVTGFLMGSLFGLSRGYDAGFRAAQPAQPGKE
jgi:hypothetical protein